MGYLMMGVTFKKIAYKICPDSMRGLALGFLEQSGNRDIELR